MLLRFQIQCCIAAGAQSPGTCCSSNSSSAAGSVALAFPYKSTIVSLWCYSGGRRMREGSSRCRSSSSNQTPQPHGAGNDDEEFLQASLLVPETLRHYRLWKQGFVEDTKWHSPSQAHSYHKKEERVDVGLIGHGYLRRFQSPTIFLKIACDGDLLLPVIVGELALIRLVNMLRDEQDYGCPDQCEFMKDFTALAGYEMKMVRITQRVINTYYARIFFGKVPKGADISIDARPSDAIHFAERFKVPIYVSKEIILKDAIKVVYGAWRGSRAKTIYDVSLDSAVEGPDPVAEELHLVRKMNSAVLEERYMDAAKWRDKLMQLRKMKDAP